MNLLKHSWIRSSLVASVVALTVSGVVAPFALSRADDTQNTPMANTALDSAFTYQGRLEIDGLPADGTFDLEFALFDDEAPDNPDVQVGLTVPKPGTLVTNGLFSVALDFGTTAFAGSQRWLEVRLAPTGETPAAVGSRQLLTATPYALFSLKTAAHTHLGETWVGDQSRSGGGLVGKALLNVSNTYVPLFTLYGGIGLKGESGKSGIGVLGTITQGTEPIVGMDLNSLVAGVVGYDTTIGCQAWCVGVRGIGGISVAGSGQSVGVVGMGATIGVRGSSSAGVGVLGVSSTGFAGRFEGNVHVEGNVFATGTVTNTSDRRLKHDIASIGYGLEAIRALKPVSYIMNSDASNTTRLGFVAQDVQEVIPELTVADPDTGNLALNYIELIPVLVNAIQEQQETIEQLQAGSRASQSASTRQPADLALPAAIAVFGLGLFAAAAALWRLTTKRAATAEGELAA